MGRLMLDALQADNVAAVRRLCRKHAAALAQSFPEDVGGIPRFVLSDACQYGATNVITWVVESCGLSTFYRRSGQISSGPSASRSSGAAPTNLCSVARRVR